MFRLIPLPVIVAMTLAVCLSTNDTNAQQTESLAGEWIARLDLASQPTVLRITVRATPERGWMANVVLQPISAVSTTNVEARRIAERWRNANVVVNGTSWSIAAGTGSNLLQVDATSTGPTATAKVRLRTHEAPVVLRHLAAVEQSREQRFVGPYVLRSGQRIYIWRSSNSGPLEYLEEATGRSGTLYPVARDSYIAGPTTLLPDPVRVRAIFRDGSDGTPQLMWQETGNEEIVATQSRAYRSEGIQLTGAAESSAAISLSLSLPVSMLLWSWSRAPGPTTDTTIT
jgi:hypothetical protein